MNSTPSSRHKTVNVDVGPRMVQRSFALACDQDKERASYHDAQTPGRAAKIADDHSGGRPLPSRFPHLIPAALGLRVALMVPLPVIAERLARD